MSSLSGLLYPSGSPPKEFVNQSPEQAEVCPPEVQGGSLTLVLVFKDRVRVRVRAHVHSTWDCKIFSSQQIQHFKDQSKKTASPPNILDSFIEDFFLSYIQGWVLLIK